MGFSQQDQNECDLSQDISKLLCSSWPSMCPFRAARGLLKAKLAKYDKVLLKRLWDNCEMNEQ